MAMGLSFVPAAYIALLVDERVSMVKHQQLVSGMEIYSYFLLDIGNLIFDLVCMLPISLFCTFFVWAFDSTLFLGEAHFPTFLVCVAYGWSITPFTYLLSLFFNSPATAQGFMLLIYFTFSVIAMTAAWIMDLIEDEGFLSPLSLSFFSAPWAALQISTTCFA